MARVGKLTFGALIYGIAIGVLFHLVYREVEVDGALGFLFAAVGLALSLLTASIYRSIAERIVRQKRPNPDDQ